MTPHNVHAYERMAEGVLPHAVWDFYHGGSDDEITLAANRAAFQGIALRPRVLVNVRAISLATTLLGAPVSMPVGIAPTALHGLAHPDGEMATARGAGAAGALMIASTSATHELEAIAQDATGPLWFQLYMHSHRQAETLIHRAEAAGYRALVLTADLPVMGNRERDVLNDWRSYPAPRAYADLFDDAGDSLLGTLTWETLGWIQSRTSLPIVIKGILTAEDAALAVAHGVAGIIVSNHGGRQLDGAISSMLALPEIVAAAGGRCDVYLDGGVRRGTDVLKALALGARAVFIGRPALWGLAVNGAAGVQHVLEILRVELIRAMALAGCPSLDAITPALVRV